MKTLNELKNNGFRLVRVMDNINVYAKRLTNDDNIFHYVYHAHATDERPEFVSDIQTTTLTNVLLHKSIFEQLVQPASWDDIY